MQEINMNLPSSASRITLDNGDYIAYYQHISKSRKNLPGIVFLGGFMSDMGGTKAVALQNFCETQDYSFLRFDYFGHGESSQTFTEGTISAWTDNAITALDRLTKGPQILVGSSMGGWVMLLAALKRPERVAGLIGIAAAPDFTKDLMWDIFPEDIRKTLKTEGIYDMSSEYSDCPYPITYELIKDGNDNLLLDKDIPIECPVTLIHGMKDDDVPYDLSMRLATRLATPHVQLNLIKDGDHRMSSEENILLLCRRIEEMLAICSNKD